MIETFKNNLNAVKDIKLNFENILIETGSPGLSQKQIAHVFLTSAYTVSGDAIIESALDHAEDILTTEEKASAKTAAAIMAMNNVYYRFTHVMIDQGYASLPAKLRMTSLANPGIDKISFELSAMAASAINGCGKCMNAHAAQLEKEGVSKEAIQSAVRIASVVNAVAKLV